jgi:hypothetical protein
MLAPTSVGSARRTTPSPIRGPIRARAVSARRWPPALFRVRSASATMGSSAAARLGTICSFRRSGSRASRPTSTGSATTEPPRFSLFRDWSHRSPPPSRVGSTTSAPSVLGSAGSGRPPCLRTPPVVLPTAKTKSALRCPTCAPPTALALTSTNTLTGWTVGAGLEWQFAPAWSVKAEYLYVDLGSRSGTIVYNYPVANTSSLTTTVKERDNIARVGLNYMFW